MTDELAAQIEGVREKLERLVARKPPAFGADAHGWRRLPVTSEAA